MTIGERIAQLLKAQGKMAKDLAEFLGISASSVTGWAHGSYPSSQYIIKISEFFGVSAEFILTGKDQASQAADTSTISEDSIRVARLWERLDEAGRAIVLGDIYRRLEVAKQRDEAGEVADAPILKEA